jgi:hypothetical protein
MSHYIGRVHSRNANATSPGFVIETSGGGVEIIAQDVVHMNQQQRGERGELVGVFVTLDPQDARVFAALLVVAADNVERMRSKT